MVAHAHTPIPAGAHDTTPGTFEPGSYHFIRSEGAAIDDYRLPIDLVRVMSSTSEGKVAKVEYQYGTSYTGEWKSWLMAGQGQKYYLGEGVEWDCVVLADVQRGNGRFLRKKEQFRKKPYKLHDNTLRRLREIEEAEYDSYENEVPVDEESTDEDVVVPDNGTDSDLGGSAESSISTIEEDSTDEDSSSDVDSLSSTSASASSDKSTSSEEAVIPAAKKRKAVAKNVATKKGKKHAVTAHLDKRRREKDSIARSVHDPKQGGRKPVRRKVGASSGQQPQGKNRASIAKRDQMERELT